MSSGKTPSSIIDKIASILGYLRQPSNKDMFRDYCNQAISQKVIDSYEGQQLIRILDLEQKAAEDIMITRSAVDVIQDSDSLDHIKKLIRKSGHSRFPVVDKDNKKVLGILLAKDLVVSRSKKSALDLVRKALFIPENKKLNNLLAEFQRKHQHMAIVINEYGDFTGVITIEDVIEQITGEIEDEHDPQHIGKNIVKENNGYYAVEGITPIEAFNQHFKCQLMDDDIDTIGGLVLKYLGYIPSKGEKLTIKQFEFIIRSASERQIKWLLVKKLKKSETNQSENT
ncbi:MAG: magnesium/cobalt efflux protein [Legionellales bacterium]|nr:magnesium/cobalt efflux protein [Legionellales bacterium]